MHSFFYGEYNVVSFYYFHAYFYVEDQNIPSVGYVMNTYRNTYT